MSNCPQINNTTIIGTSAVTYDSTPLPCTNVTTCDGLNDILSKFDAVICDVKASVDILTEEIIDITEDIMIITEDIININNQLEICCPNCNFSGTANQILNCNFTGTANQLPDPTTTTTSSSSTSTTTSTTAVPTTTTTSSSSSTTTTTSSSTSTSTSSSTTTTSTTAPVYTYAGTVVNNTANPITAGTAIIKVNGSGVAYVTLNIAPGATQTFNTTYSVPVSGIGNDFTIELYTYTGVTTSNTMKQEGGDCGTSTGTFVNMGSYLMATSTTTGPGVCSVFVIAMTIS